MRSSILLAILFLVQPAAAENLQGPALGFGTRLCKDWTSTRAAGGLNSAMAQQWLFGYLSGFDAFGPSRHGLFFQYDGQHVVTFIDRSCRGQPDRPIANVVHDFILGLEATRMHFHNKKS
jgi:hypothetical protein